MNHTKNYNLPQWELDDLIRMEDFNGAMENLENGLTRMAEDASTAKSTANAAMAQAKLLPYVTGSYTGTGATMSIELGFEPSFLILCGVQQTGATNNTTTYDRFSVMTAGGVDMGSRVQLTRNGFMVYTRMHNGYNYPDFTLKDRTYDYIAFR